MANTRYHNLHSLKLNLQNSMAGLNNIKAVKMANDMLISSIIGTLNLLIKVKDTPNQNKKYNGFFCLIKINKPTIDAINKMSILTLKIKIFFVIIYHYFNRKLFYVIVNNIYGGRFKSIQ